MTRVTSAHDKVWRKAGPRFLSPNPPLRLLCPEPKTKPVLCECREVSQVKGPGSLWWNTRSVKMSRARRYV